MAVIDALLGRKEDAITEAKRAIEMLPLSKDKLDGPVCVINLAQVYAWTGELEDLRIRFRAKRALFSQRGDRIYSDSA